jgi:hypothetical protein
LRGEGGESWPKFAAPLVGLRAKTASQPPLALTDVKAASRLRSFLALNPIKYLSLHEFTTLVRHPEKAGFCVNLGYQGPCLATQPSKSSRSASIMMELLRCAMEGLGQGIGIVSDS